MQRRELNEAVVEQQAEMPRLGSQVVDPSEVLAFTGSRRFNVSENRNTAGTSARITIQNEQSTDAEDRSPPTDPTLLVLRHRLIPPSRIRHPKTYPAAGSDRLARTGSVPHESRQNASFV